jgi:pseudouridine-5'-phosphate glycosidase
LEVGVLRDDVAFVTATFNVFFARPPSVSITLFATGNIRGASRGSRGSIDISLEVDVKVEPGSWFVV